MCLRSRVGDEGDEHHRARARCTAAGRCSSRPVPPRRPGQGLAERSALSSQRTARVPAVLRAGDAGAPRAVRGRPGRTACCGPALRCSSAWPARRRSAPSAPSPSTAISASSCWVRCWRPRRERRSIGSSPSGSPRRSACPRDTGGSLPRPRSLPPGRPPVAPARANQPRARRGSGQSPSVRPSPARSTTTTPGASTASRATRGSSAPRSTSPASARRSSRGGGRRRRRGRAIAPRLAAPAPSASTRPRREGASCGPRFGRRGPRGAIGHLGFTGTSLWIDLDRQSRRRVPHQPRRAGSLQHPHS